MKLLPSKRRAQTALAALFTAAAAIGFALAPASAALESRDFMAAGDGLLTFDPGSNLEWLDLTLTQGLSYNQTLAGAFVDGGGGFAFATVVQVGTLFTNAGIGNILGNNLVLDRIDAEALVNLLGITETTPSGNTTFFAAKGWADLVPIGVQASLSIVNFNPGNNTGFAQALGSTSVKTNVQAGVGSFLIRDASSISAIPLPTALPLFGTGLAVMGFMGWRRRRQKAIAAS